MRPTVKIDAREFNETLRRYKEFSKRDPATICNTKAFYIARRATIETPKSTRAQIKEDLMKQGDLGAPIAALIINKQRRLAGLPGLEGRDMKKAIADLIKTRRVATLKAGWIPAIKKLEPLAERRGIPRMDRSAKEFGRPKGRATPARDGMFICNAIIENTAGAKWDKRDLATTKAFPALEKAFEAERQSTLTYIERKMRETAHKAGIKTD